MSGLFHSLKDKFVLSTYILYVYWGKGITSVSDLENCHKILIPSQDIKDQFQSEVEQLQKYIIWPDFYKNYRDNFSSDYLSYTKTIKAKTGGKFKLVFTKVSLNKEGPIGYIVNGFFEPSINNAAYVLYCLLS